MTGSYTPRSKGGLVSVVCFDHQLVCFGRHRWGTGSDLERLSMLNDFSSEYSVQLSRGGFYLGITRTFGPLNLGSLSFKSYSAQLALVAAARAQPVRVSSS